MWAKIKMISIMMGCLFLFLQFSQPTLSIKEQKLHPSLYKDKVAQPFPKPVPNPDLSSTYPSKRAELKQGTENSSLQQQLESQILQIDDQLEKLGFPNSVIRDHLSPQDSELVVQLLIKKESLENHLFKTRYQAFKESL